MTTLIMMKTTTTTLMMMMSIFLAHDSINLNAQCAHDDEDKEDEELKEEY